MRLHPHILHAVAAGMLFATTPVQALAPLGPRLQRALARTPPPQPVAVWVDFRDKPAPFAVEKVVSERSLERRRRRGSASALVERIDWPLSPMYTSAVASEVSRIRAGSKWLNSLSVEATADQIAALRTLPQVASIELVAGATPRQDLVPSPEPLGPGYGDSGDQLRLIHVDALHDRGLTGLGVLVAHFDTGYYSLHHEVFRPMRIAAAYDFVDRDADVTDARSNPDDTLEHGQYTLSVLGGFKPGKLVGVAPGATYILARTESTALENDAEEDYWIAALEWADSLGADIVSSSLKFLNYDIPATGYDWTDMNGVTARVTRAADLAAQRGILIVNGAGNEGPNPVHNTLVAPADGTQVLAVGAVTLGSVRAAFSSVGPTTDAPPRIKPDVMAPGVAVVCADIFSDSSYTRVGGTSLATPLAAGVAALLLSVHDATPLQIIAALRQTASRATSPDNEYGWGILDAEAAWEHLIALFPTDAGAAARSQTELRFANPFRPAGRIFWHRNDLERVRLRIYDALGRQVRDWAPSAGTARLDWNGTDASGQLLPNGVYLVELQGKTRSTVRKLTLLH